MSSHIWLIILFPLLGFLINGLLGRWMPRKLAAWVACLSIFASFAVSASIFLEFLALPPAERILDLDIFPWIVSGDLQVYFGLRIDALSLVMCLIVTGVGFLIHVYSAGYMHHDPGFVRYFTYLNLFVFMMLLLVTGNNLLVMFVGWEGVGLCSYLLIGFWYEKDSAANAGKKAFIVNRIGDFGFLLGIFLLFVSLGDLGVWTLKFSEIAPHATLLDPAVVTWITLLFFVGAVGKSAQIPLYTWLPDAMEGPTPVSSLIHAATMVTAGVYMIVRLNFLYSLAPDTMFVIALVGVLTAFFAASIGIAQNDIKKVLAYSTISQLGFMFVAVGVGAYAAGIFHLMTHAFFKGLLFLGAGSVIHAMSGEQDIQNMGGLRKKLPITYVTFLIACLAIAGIPGLSGFFSKDEILWKAFSAPQGHTIIWLLAAITAAMTAFYMFRLLFTTFHGQCRASEEVKHHIHESPRLMTIPLMILGFLSLVGGYVGIPHVLGGENRFEKFLSPLLAPQKQLAASGWDISFISQAWAATTASPHETALEIALMALSVLLAAAGIFLAYHLYLRRPGLSSDIAARYSGLHRLIENKYFVDEIYDRIFVQGVLRLGRFCARFVDEGVIERFVNGTGSTMNALGGLVRRVQAGYVQGYAFGIIAGAIVLLAYMTLRPLY